MSESSDTARRRSVTTHTSSSQQAGTEVAVPMKLLYTLIVLCLCIAWFAPVRDAFTRRMWPSIASGPREAYTFIALAYGEYEDQTRNVSPIQNIDQHLDALSANGYKPISLQDALSLIQLGKPVPGNAVLITVDSYKRKIIAQANKALRNHGWNGVLFVPTKPVNERAKGAVSWSQLKGLVDSSNLDVCSMGHHGIETVKSAADTSTGNYLTTQLWIDDDNRLESIAELQARVVRDHNQSRELVKAHLDSTPLAYAYPYGDFGQFCHPDDYVSQLNLSASASFYELAFMSGGVGLNTMFSDVSRLNRLRVSPTWSAAELIDALEANHAGAGEIEDIDLARRTSGWISDWGMLSLAENGIRLEAAPNTKGARAWMAGSDLRRDLSATVRFSINKGNASIYLRASDDDSSYILLQLSPSGTAIIQQKTSWESPIITLASTRTPIRSGRQHTLNVFLRDSYFDALLDGLPIFQQSVRLRGNMQAGKFGISTMAETAGTADVLVSDAVVQSRQSTLASWDLPPKYEPYIMDWLHQHAGRLTEISPTWTQLQKATIQYTDRDEASVYRRLARMYNLRLMPKIVIESDEDLTKWTPTLLADRMGESDCDGLYVSFERYADLKVARLDNWLRQTSKKLSGYGRPILVRLPPMLERLAAVNALVAVIPAVEIVTGQGSSLPVATLNAKPIQEDIISEPDPKTVRALPVAFAITDKSDDDGETTGSMKINELREEAEGAFLRGAYESAIAAFSQWHQLDPSSPLPLTRIGDALVSMGYLDEAVGFFRQSLSLDPGQIELAVRQARLLTNLNERERAKGLLNSYARLFPNNTDILFAQAEWLYRENRNSEAEARIERILTLDQYNFDASLFMLRLASDETSRQQAVDRLMALSNTPERHYDLANAVWQYDLLTLPDSHLLISMLEDIASQSKDERVQVIVNRLRPRTEPVTETFTDGTGISDAWQIDGAVARVKEGQLSIQANPSRDEFTVRLLRSERWRDSYVETEISDVEGGFWLYGRRSRNHLVRFGFDENEDRLYLQVWKGKNNDVVLNQFIPWSIPQDSFTLRLEVRGNGISAQINGKPVFDVPLAIPGDFGLGWMAISGHSRNRGESSVALKRIDSGPLPVRLAMLPQEPDESGDSPQLKQLHNMLGSITDLSPDWFSIDKDGAWNSQPGADDDFFRVFARYYRIRLVPTVRIAPGAKVLPSDILTVTRTHDFDGLVLLFEEMPPDAWFEQMDRELGGPGLDILAVAMDDYSSTGSMRGVAASRTLFQSSGTVKDVPIIECGGDNETATPANSRGILIF